MIDTRSQFHVLISPPRLYILVNVLKQPPQSLQKHLSLIKPLLPLSLIARLLYLPLPLHLLPPLPPQLQEACPPPLPLVPTPQQKSQLRLHLPLPLPKQLVLPLTLLLPLLLLPLSPLSPNSMQREFNL